MCPVILARPRSHRLALHCDKGILCCKVPTENAVSSSGGAHAGVTLDMPTMCISGVQSTGNSEDFVDSRAQGAGTDFSGNPTEINSPNRTKMPAMSLEGGECDCPWKLREATHGRAKEYAQGFAP